MTILKDSNGKLRMEYFNKMCRAEEQYNIHVNAIASLDCDLSKVNPGSDMSREILRKIELRRIVRDQALTEFRAYAAALTAVSTAILK